MDRLVSRGTSDQEFAESISLPVDILAELIPAARYWLEPFMFRSEAYDLAGLHESSADVRRE